MNESQCISLLFGEGNGEVGRHDDEPELESGMGWTMAAVG